MLEKLKNRRNDLVKIVEQSAVNHNSILGRLSEVQEWIKILEDEEVKASESVVDEVKEVVGEVV